SARTTPSAGTWATERTRAGNRGEGMGTAGCCLPVRGEEDTARTRQMTARRERIASLLPAATEIVCALGLEESLVGRSHECDFPPSVRRLPILTRPRGGSTTFSGGSG